MRASLDGRGEPGGNLGPALAPAEPSTRSGRGACSCSAGDRPGVLAACLQGAWGRAKGAPSSLHLRIARAVVLEACSRGPAWASRLDWCAGFVPQSGWYEAGGWLDLMKDDARHPMLKMGLTWNLASCFVRILILDRAKLDGFR